jgi:hypothetical protein
VPEVFVPCAITAEPGAVADCASRSQSPAAKNPAFGKRASIASGPVEVNHVGGSMIAVSCAG